MVIGVVFIKLVESKLKIKNKKVRLKSGEVKNYTYFEWYIPPVSISKNDPSRYYIVDEYTMNQILTALDKAVAVIDVYKTAYEELWKYTERLEFLLDEYIEKFYTLLNYVSRILCEGFRDLECNHERFYRIMEMYLHDLAVIKGQCIKRGCDYQYEEPDIYKIDTELEEMLVKARRVFEKSLFGTEE